jgi:secreted trypsin-like serine protease
MKFFLVIFLLSSFCLSKCESSKVDSFIIGGSEADIADFPYQLALYDMIRGGVNGYM